MLLDSYAWIEFFNGTEKGREVKKVLKEGKCYTSIISLAEIAEVCSRTDKNVNDFIDKIKNFSTILFLNETVSTVAGKLNFQRKKVVKGWGMMDSFILATALANNLPILTGDKHFKDLPNTKIL